MREIDSDEHYHFKDSPLGGSYAPNLEELKKVNLGLVGEKLGELLAAGETWGDNVETCDTICLFDGCGAAKVAGFY